MAVMRAVHGDYNVKVPVSGSGTIAGLPATLHLLRPEHRSRVICIKRAGQIRRPEVRRTLGNQQDIGSLSGKAQKNNTRGTISGHLNDGKRTG